MAARAIVTTPSSIGWRSTSSTFLRNSGSSSRNSTPPCARLTSPGRGYEPPPIRPASEIVWCGDRNGRRAQGQHARHGVDLGRLERLFETYLRQDGRDAAGQHRLAAPWWADHQDVVPAGRRHLEGALGVGLPFHLGEVDVVARALREQRGQVDTGLRQLRLTVERSE